MTDKPIIKRVLPETMRTRALREECALYNACLHGSNRARLAQGKTAVPVIPAGVCKGCKDRTKTALPGGIVHLLSGDIWLYGDGQPCHHPGCASHVSHPCEGCGRVGARGEAFRRVNVI